MTHSNGAELFSQYNPDTIKLTVLESKIKTPVEQWTMLQTFDKCRSIFILNLTQRNFHSKKKRSLVILTERFRTS